MTRAPTSSRRALSVPTLVGVTDVIRGPIKAGIAAFFAVGVPWEGELAHFDIENPSGLHEGVEARPLCEPE